MKKKLFPKWLVYGLFAFFVLTLYLYRSGDIGMSERAMQEENRDWGKDDYTVISDIGDTMAVYFQYNEDRTDVDCRIYVKRKGAIGWFFRYGGSAVPASGEIRDENVYRMGLEENEEYVLLGMNDGAIDRIEVITSEGSEKTICPEAGKPFAHVLKRTWEVTVYGADGQIIRSVERKM